jgi:hypothetical protein
MYIAPLGGPGGRGHIELPAIVFQVQPYPRNSDNAALSPLLATCATGDAIAVETRNRRFASDHLSVRWSHLDAVVVEGWRVG